MYNEKGILWKSILEIQGIPLIVIPYRYGVLTLGNVGDIVGTIPCQVDTYKNENTIFLIRPNRGNIPPRFGHFF